MVFFKHISFSQFEANLNIAPRELEKLITAADRNKDGFVDRSEFIRLVSNRDKKLSKYKQLKNETFASATLIHCFFQEAAEPSSAVPARGGLCRGIHLLPTALVHYRGLVLTDIGLHLPHSALYPQLRP
jgi:hypothetical protein